MGAERRKANPNHKGTEEAEAELEELSESASEADGTEATVEIEAENNVSDEAEEAIEDVGELDGMKAETTLTADNSGVKKSTTESNKLANSVKQNTPTRLMADNSQLIIAVESAQNAIDSIQGRTVDIRLELKGYDSVLADIRRLQREATIETKTQQSSQQIQSGTQIQGGTQMTAASSSWLANRATIEAANAATSLALSSSSPTRVMLDDGFYAKLGDMGGTTVYVNLNYKAGDDANKVARDIGRALERQMRARR